MVNILILSDGKAGHLNQSLAIAKRIKGAEIKIVKPGWNKISKLLKIKADLVISTGSKLVFYNYFLGKLKGPKRIVCQRTSPFPSFLFDLVVLPFHDLYVYPRCSGKARFAFSLSLRACVSRRGNPLRLLRRFTPRNDSRAIPAFAGTATPFFGLISDNFVLKRNGERRATGRKRRIVGLVNVARPKINPVNAQSPILNLLFRKRNKAQ